MNVYKLTKNIVLYKHQFDTMCVKLFNGYDLDRTSLELDSLLFRIKYMINHNKNQITLPDLQKEFTAKAIDLRNLFGEFCHALLLDVLYTPPEIGNPKYYIKDILIRDVKIDSINVRFDMDIISENEKYINYLNDTLEDNEVLNIFPNDYFRYNTDSYNDAIAKAYPELFENKEQHIIGTGADKEVFTHSLTFQVTERCSLQCTYCLIKGTDIKMADYSTKKIEDIQVGDIVLGFNEDLDSQNKLYPTKVTKLFHRKSKVFMITIYGGKNELQLNHSGDIHIFITEEHPILTSKGWKRIDEINETEDSLVCLEEMEIGKAVKGFERSYTCAPIYIEPGWYNIECSYDLGEKDVYNFETESHTYIANNLLVHNCYQFNKTPMRMEFETAKKFIDKLLNDEYGYINRYNSPAIIIEFIGGEPLLEIKLIRQIYEYFLDRCYDLNHPWFKLHRLSICSNGLAYFEKDVQDFFKDYIQNISFNISIDGNRELHDTCRIQPNGEGSYDIDMLALNHFNDNYTSERNSKMTLSPSNMKYLYESVIDFINKGMMSINLNCIFEEGWNQETALEEYNQLKKLADYIIDNDLYNIYIAIFRDRQEGPSEKSMDGAACGGELSMFAIRPNGDFYPCIRYMPTSVGNDVKDLCIGNIDNGVISRADNNEITEILDNVTRRGSTNDICYECPINNSCQYCLALNHTIFNTPNKRVMFTCIQMYAEHLANVYYWNRLIVKHPEFNLDVRHLVIPDEWSLLVIDQNELDELKLLESYAIAKKIGYDSK